MKIVSYFFCAGLGLSLTGCALQPPKEPGTLLPGHNVLPPQTLWMAKAGKVDFNRHVKPILEAKCVVCHSADAQPKGLHMESRAAAKKSGVLGGFIVAGHPERSALLTSLKTAHEGLKPMPPVGEQLTEDEIVILKRWIAQGAHWPASS